MCLCVCLSESSLLAYAVFTILQSGNHQFSILPTGYVVCWWQTFWTQIRTERRSGLTEHPSLSGSKMFDNLKVFLIYFFQKRDIEKIQQTTKIMKNSPISSVLLKKKTGFILMKDNNEKAYQGLPYRCDHNKNKIHNSTLFNYVRALPLSCRNLPAIFSSSINTLILHSD